MNQTHLAVIVVTTVLLFAFVFWQLDIVVRASDVFVILIFFCVIGVVTFLFLKKVKPYGGKLTTLQTVTKIRELWLEDKGMGTDLHISETFGRVSTRRWEELNKEYKAFRFLDSEDNQVIIIWDCLENDIADFEFNPSAERRDDPFKGFEPIVVKYRKSGEAAPTVAITQYEKGEPAIDNKKVGKEKQSDD